MQRIKSTSIVIAFAIAISSLLTSCSPLIKRYDSKDTKEMHERMQAAESRAKTADRRAKMIKEEYQRVYDLWNEADGIIQEQQEALDECRRNK